MLGKALLSAARRSGIQYVGSATAVNTSSASSINVALNSLTGGIDTAARSGDVVIVCVNSRYTSSVTMSASGYTSLAQLYINHTYDPNLGVLRKVLSAADAAVNVSWGVSTGTAAAVAHVWRGVHQTTPEDATTTTATGTGTGVPDAPSITTVTNGAVVLAIGGGAGSAGADSVYGPAAPSGMSNGRDTEASNASSCGVAAYAQSTAGAYNPGVFTDGGTGSGCAWATATVALRPA